MARTVAGTLLLPTGQPMANARIYFVAKRTEAVSIVDGANASFTTNASGAYSQSIVNGFYAVSIEVPGDFSGSSPRRYPLGDVVIETASTTTIEALLIANNPTSDLPLTIFQQMLTDAQNAASAAQASAAAAAASAASVTVGTAPTNIPSNNILNTRLGTTGNLGSMALQSSSAVAITGGNANSLTSVSALNLTGPLAFPLSASAGGVTQLSSGVRCFSPGVYDYGMVVNANAGGLEFHANQGGAGEYRWYTGDVNQQTQKMRLRSIGQLEITNGVKVGNIANADAGVLDWYEEGSFTPTVVGTVSAGTAATYSMRIGKFQRVGNRVHFQVNIVYEGHTGTGNLRIAGLPYLSSASASNSIPSVYRGGVPITADAALQAFISPGGSVIDFDQCAPSGQTFALAISPSATLLVAGSYEV